jgi:hypothetical protein
MKKEQAWNDYEAFEKLIAQKSYTQLLPAELKMVNQFVADEQEYETLRSSDLAMKAWFANNPVVPNDKTLTNLKLEFNKAHQRQVSLSWWKVSIGYALAALVFGLSGWWLGQSASEKKAPLTSIEKVLVHDTVYVASKPDTIFTEKIIYRDSPVILTTTNRQSEPPVVKGVSMKEKEELDKLLVSGSR